MMMRFVAWFLASSVMFANPVLAGKKIPNRNWEMGKVVDSQRSQEFAGTVDRPGVVLTNGRRITNDSKAAIYRTQQTFVIENETHTYTVSEVGGKPADLTVNGPVKFAIEGTVLYLIGDDGKEHMTEIIKKVLRTKDAPPAVKQ